MRSVLLVMFLCPMASAAPNSRCVVEPVAAPAAVASEAPPCHRGPPVTEAAIRAAITDRYSPERDSGSPQVTFSCDGLGAGIREIVIERGSGHGGGLSLWRARAAPAGALYDVRGIVYSRPPNENAAATPPYKLAAGAVLLPGLETARAALAATVREVAPPPPPGTIGGLHLSSSSSDFHLVIRLTDDAGRVLERQYTGYAGSGNQDRFLLLAIAAEALGEITTVGTASTAPGEADRALFDERFAASVPHFDDPFYWWVTERYVDLSLHLGTRASIAGLLTRLVVPKKADRAKLAVRASAVDALARITGWDARAGGYSTEDAAKRYLAECKPPAAE